MKTSRFFIFSKRYFIIDDIWKGERDPPPFFIFLCDRGCVEVWKRSCAGRVTTLAKALGAKSWVDASKATIGRKAFCSRSGWTTGSTRSARFGSSTSSTTSSISGSRASPWEGLCRLVYRCAAHLEPKYLTNQWLIVLGACPWPR